MCVFSNSENPLKMKGMACYYYTYPLRSHFQLGYLWSLIDIIDLTWVVTEETSDYGSKVKGKRAISKLQSPIDIHMYSPGMNRA